MSATRRALKEAFLTLLEARPLRDITVRDIVQLCGVNRNSFYYHYKDIPSLLEEAVTEWLDRIIDSRRPAASLADCLEAVAQEAALHRQLVLHISQSGHRELFENRLMEVCGRAVRDYAAAAFGEVRISREDREILLRFFQCECFGQMMAWLGNGMRYDLQAQFRRLCWLGEGMTELLLKRAAQSEADREGGK